VVVLGLNYNNDLTLGRYEVEGYRLGFRIHRLTKTTIKKVKYWMYGKV